MQCNIDKTVCMMFPPVRRRCVITNDFQLFKIGDQSIRYVNIFKYLDHMIVNYYSDDQDIEREIHNIFVRCNILYRKFCKCSLPVKVQLL